MRGLFGDFSQQGFFASKDDIRWICLQKILERISRIKISHFQLSRTIRLRQQENYDFSFSWNIINFLDH